jgi:hypothetical protein
VSRTDPRVAIADRYRARVLPKLEALQAAAQLAHEQAWVNVGWPTDAVAPDFGGDDGDAIVAMREDLADLHAAPYVPLRCTTLYFDPVRVGVQLLGLARPERDAIGPQTNFYVRHLEQLARARYALIVVTHERKVPAVDGGSAFEAGSVRGAALLCELATCELRGAFEFFAENSWQVKGTDRTIEDKLRANLESRFSRAIVGGIRARFPAGRAPATLGFV